jgi:hypothetical protein
MMLLLSILRPNTPYFLLTLEHTVLTGGFYLSTHTLYETLIGQIHSFVLPSLLTEGKRPQLTIFARRMVHYMHNAYVLNDSSDREHLLSFTTMDDVRDIFSLITLAIFLNVFDERTYQLPSDTFQKDHAILLRCHDVFDLNAIPVVERHHLCYTRGLSIELLNWFFQYYTISSVEFEEDDIDANVSVFVPFVVHIGRQIIRYKCLAEESGHTTSPTSKQVTCQIQWALFGFEFMRDTWLEQKAEDEEREYRDDADDERRMDSEYNDLDFDLSNFSITLRHQPALRNNRAINCIEIGKTAADHRFFCGLASRFDVEEFGKFPLAN